ncbi:MAG: VRR-NUC domain-containing protein, partial [Spirochaetales bacterium]|nr:VRR-NUC domain-containing protein [Spirochaetales bacterium]
QIPDPEHNRQVLRRFGRICNTLARQIERVGDGRTAAEIYNLTSLPPSRERQVRILFSDSSYSEASELCDRILADPLNEEEHDFALTFSHRIEKKGNPAAKAPISLVIPTQHHDLVDVVPDSVEEYSLLGFMENGNDGYYTENTLWGGMFALAFWDIIFLPLTGVFFNPFQSAPADIFTEEFYQRRAHEIDRRLNDISTDDKWPLHFLAMYKEKTGISNAFVNWKLLPIELIVAAIEAIPKIHLTAIFERMVRDLRSNTSGFPDLIVFPKKSNSFTLAGDTDLPYLLIEVKGPGDQVQKNQKRWMRYFREIGVPFRVLRLNRPRRDKPLDDRPRA